MKKIVINVGEDSSWRLSPKAIEIPDGVEYKIIDDSGLGPERICFNA